MRCISCKEKIKNHVKLFYLFEKTIKMKFLKLKQVTSSHLIPQKREFADHFINFNTRPKVKVKLQKPVEVQEFVEDIKTGMVCLDCFKVITDIIKLDYAYYQISFTLFLYFYSHQLDIKPDSGLLEESEERISQEISVNL